MSAKLHRILQGKATRPKKLPTQIKTICTNSLRKLFCLFSACFAGERDGGAPKERRRRRAGKRLSKRVFLESPFLLCPLKVFRTFQVFLRTNLKGAEKKRTLQKHLFGQPFLRTTPSTLLWRTLKGDNFYKLFRDYLRKLCFIWGGVSFWAIFARKGFRWRVRVTKHGTSHSPRNLSLQNPFLSYFCICLEKQCSWFFRGFFVASLWPSLLANFTRTLASEKGKRYINF